MQIEVVALLRARRGGIEAYAPSIGLAGHGDDVDTAVSCLRGGVEAWASALRRAGELERVLLRRHVTFVQTDSGDIKVDVTAPEPEMAT